MLHEKREDKKDTHKKRRDVKRVINQLNFNLSRVSLSILFCAHGVEDNDERKC